VAELVEARAFNLRRSARNNASTGSATGFLVTQSLTEVGSLTEVFLLPPLIDTDKKKVTDGHLLSVFISDFLLISVHQWGNSLELWSRPLINPWFFSPGVWRLWLPFFLSGFLSELSCPTFHFLFLWILTFFFVYGS
jgi:hypothetical protein